MGKNSNIQKRRLKKLTKIDSGIGLKVKDAQIIRLGSSIFLLIVVYLIFQVNQPYALKVQEFIEETLTREFNFSGVYDIYEEKFAGSPAIIPTLVKKDNDEYSEYAFILPITNSPLVTKQTEQGIILKIEKEEKVVAIGKGIIENVGKNDVLGNTILIRHQNGILVTYAMLKDITVEIDEWVEKGQEIGSVVNNLYFSISKQNEYLNPMEVISFE